MVYKFIHKKSAIHKGICINSNLDCQNQQLTEEFHKQVISKLKKRKVYLPFIETDMEVISLIPP